MRLESSSALPRRLLVFSMACCLSGMVLAQTTITYQGQLEQQGQLYNGTIPAANISFELFDNADPNVGNSMAGPINPARDVVVTDGRFQVELDFGNVFDGTPLFLAIQIEGALLSPRQAINAVPYAIQAAYAENAGISGACSASQAVTEITTDGTVVCGTFGTGDITSVTAGSGLAGGGSSGALTLDIGTGAVDQTHLAADSVGADEIATGAVGSSEIAPGAVGMTEINAANLPSGDASITLAPTFGATVWLLSTEGVTMPASGQCLVWATGQHALFSGASPSNMVEVRTARQGPGALIVDDGSQGVFSPNSGGEITAPATTFAVWPVEAGETYQFGCQIYRDSDLFYSRQAFCRVTWMCF